MSHEEPIRAVRLLRIGTVRAALLSELAERVSVFTALPCRAGGAAAIEPEALPGREQVDADRMLADLERLPREPGWITAGVTLADIGSPIFSHHFGRARRGGRALVVSLARLTPVFYGLPEDQATTLRRAALELLHELGHLAGLGHCHDFGCIMRFARAVEDIDNRGVTFCATCAAASALPCAVG